jgi:predicted enzyme related to lactoylglutathione lyase
VYGRNVEIEDVGHAIRCHKGFRRYQTIAWAIIPTDQDIKDKPRTGLINYRVKNMGDVLSHLKSKGVAIEKTEEYPSYGHFAWLKDPDGNKIELWETSGSE